MILLSSKHKKSEIVTIFIFPTFYILNLKKCSSQRDACDNQSQYSRLNIQYDSFSRFGIRLRNSIPQNTKLLLKQSLKKKIKMQLLQHLTKNKTYKEPEKLIHAFSRYLRPFFILYSLCLVCNNSVLAFKIP